MSNGEFQCISFTHQSGAFFEWRYSFSFNGTKAEAVGSSLEDLRANLHRELEHVSGDRDFWFEVATTPCGRGLTVGVNREA